MKLTLPSRRTAIRVPLVLLAVLGVLLLIAGSRVTHKPAAAPLPSSHPLADSPPTRPSYSMTGTAKPSHSAARPASPVPPSSAHAVQPGVPLRVTRPSRTSAYSLTIPALRESGIPVLGSPCVIRNRVLLPPDSVHDVCRWGGGSGLDAATGMTTLTGHVNFAGQGAGAFARIADLRVGDALFTADRTGHITTWRITKVEARLKSHGVNTAVKQGPNGPRGLSLITCGGALVNVPGYGNSYDHNVYVFAVPH